MDTNSTPTLTPPHVGSSETTGASAPDPAFGPDGNGTASTAVGAPTQLPTSGAGAAAAQAVTATWRNGVTVDAVFCVNEVRNAWMRLVGVGWRKLYNGRDGAFTALVTLAAQARQTGRTINIREEADGMVYEIYLW